MPEALAAFFPANRGLYFDGFVLVSLFLDFRDSGFGADRALVGLEFYGGEVLGLHLGAGFDASVAALDYAGGAVAGGLVVGEGGGYRGEGGGVDGEGGVDAILGFGDVVEGGPKGGHEDELGRHCVGRGVGKGRKLTVLVNGFWSRFY